MTTDLSFQKWHEEFCDISTGIFPNWFRWKSKEELCLVTLRVMQKLKKKLTLPSKNDMRNLVNFNASSGRSESLHFDVLLL